jgi:hypothetical protein
MDQERDHDTSENIRAERRSEIVRAANDHIILPLPRTPRPHEDVSNDGDDEEHPRSIDREAVRGPVRVVEKVAIHFRYLIVADLIHGTDRWIQRCHIDPLSGDERPYVARLPDTIEFAGEPTV